MFEYALPREEPPRVPQGIARGQLLEDFAVARIVDEVDLPTGGGTVLEFDARDGFMRRWLAANRPGAAYAHGDPAEAPSGRYDGVFALETPVGTDARARAIAGHLNSLGRYAATILSLDGAHERRVFEAIALLQAHTDVLKVANLTADLRDAAACRASTHLLAVADGTVEATLGLTAARVLHALDRETFAYTLIVGTRLRGS